MRMVTMKAKYAHPTVGKSQEQIRVCVYNDSSYLHPMLKAVREKLGWLHTMNDQRLTVYAGNQLKIPNTMRLNSSNSSDSSSSVARKSIFNTGTATLECMVSEMNDNVTT